MRSRHKENGVDCGTAKCSLNTCSWCSMSTWQVGLARSSASDWHQGAHDVQHYFVPDTLGQWQKNLGWKDAKSPDALGAEKKEVCALAHVCASTSSCRSCQRECQVPPGVAHPHRIALLAVRHPLSAWHRFAWRWRRGWHQCRIHETYWNAIVLQLTGQTRYKVRMSRSTSYFPW